MRLLQVLPGCVQSHYDLVLAETMFVWAYWLALRISELASVSGSDHTLKLSNLSMLLEGPYIVAYKVRFDSFKHAGSDIVSCTVQAVRQDICPVKFMFRYLALRIPSSQALFCKCGGAVSRDWFATLLKTACALADLDPNRYNTHSFRVGRCTDWVEQGLTVTQIRSRGRWKSFAFLRYVRPEAIRF